MSTPPPMNMPPPPGPASAPGAIPNHMVWAIVATVLGFCLCCPSIVPGIIAIVYASQVNGKLNAGDTGGAREASDKAKLWSWITTGMAILGLLISIVMMMTGGFEQYAEQMRVMQGLQGR